MSSTAALSSLKITRACCTTFPLTRPLSRLSRTVTSMSGTDASGATTASYTCDVPFALRMARVPFRLVSVRANCSVATVSLP